MSLQNNYVIGVDYGTDSVRAIIVDAANGHEMASSVYYYPLWKKGLYCNASLNRFRQHPMDYLQGLETTIKDCLQKAGASVAAMVKGISVDTTGSSPVAVNRQGTPLALLPAFAHNPNAMFILWKDHTAIAEAAEINEHAQKYPVNYLKYVGGIYSSEWFWAKLLHILKKDEAVRDATFSFVEHCDWIPFVLAGGNDVTKMKRSVCAAGHKALFAPEWNGLPPNSWFTDLDPLLDGFTERLYNKAFTAAGSVGTLCPAWAGKLGLAKNVVIGVGAFDAHMGAVGGQIEPYYLSKVMGTSTCDMLVAPTAEVGDTLVAGICGQVNGSIIPGMIGMEAGQSAFGDAYAWFKNILTWPLQQLVANTTLVDVAVAEQLVHEAAENMIAELCRQAQQLTVDVDGELALDWLNGRRTPDANQQLKGAIINLDLASDAPKIFRAIVEATCFGARAIVNRFTDQGIKVKGLIGLGGVAKKSPYIMQMMADVMDMPIRIHKSEQTCALGAAMFAATAAGIYANVYQAMNAMGQGFDAEYTPNAQNVAYYQQRSVLYRQLGAFVEQQLTVPQPPLLAQAI